MALENKNLDLFESFVEELEKLEDVNYFDIDTIFYNLGNKGYSTDNCMGIAKELVLRSLNVDEKLFEGLISDDEVFKNTLLYLIDKELELDDKIKEEVLGEGDAYPDDKQNLKIIKNLTIETLFSLVIEINQKKKREYNEELKTVDVNLDTVKRQIKKEDNLIKAAKIKKEDLTKEQKKLKSDEEETDQTINKNTASYNNQKIDLDKLKQINKQTEGHAEKNEEIIKDLDEKIQKEIKKLIKKLAMAIAIVGIAAAILALAITPAGTAAIIGGATQLFGAGISSTIAVNTGLMVMASGALSGMGLSLWELGNCFKIISGYKENLQKSEATLREINQAYAQQRNIERSIRNYESALPGLNQKKQQAIEKQKKAQESIEKYDQEVKNHDEEKKTKSKEYDELKEQRNTLIDDIKNIAKTIRAIENIERSVKYKPKDHPIHKRGTHILRAYEKVQDQSENEDKDKAADDIPEKHLAKAFELKKPQK